MAARRQAHATAICDEGIELTEQAVPRKSANPPLRADDWATRQRARELDRALRRPMYFGGSSVNSTTPGTRRFDPPQSLLDQYATVPPPTVATTVSTTPPVRQSHSRAGQVMAWLVVASGTIVLLAGIGLIGWSLSAKQMQHWNLALSLTLGGQGALILGLVMVVSRLWRNSRYAASKLQEMHARLGQLQNTADTISAMRGGAPAFYADLARGASPQMLLSNLKGQLDQLATRFGS
jgi:hypothetical protein